MMKCEFIKLAQEIKMPLLNDTVGDDDYAILENMYYVMDIHKSKFVQIVKAMGMETAIEKHRHWAYMRKAQEHYEAFLKYTKAKVADKMNYSVNHIQGPAHRKALENFSEIFDIDSK